MLVQFSLTNYKNFKETQALDLTEGKISEHARHLLKSPIDRLGIAYPHFGRSFCLE